MAVVLVEFPCSFNGITSETMVVGSEHDFRGMTAGLVGMGWISEEPVDVVEPVIEPVEPVIEQVVEPVIETAPDPAAVAEPVAETEPVVKGKRK